MATLPTKASAAEHSADFQFLKGLKAGFFTGSPSRWRNDTGLCLFVGTFFGEPGLLKV
jgi:hypothetical protein